MAEDWTAVAAEVAEGIAEVGAPATLYRRAGSNPYTGATPAATTPRACVAVITEWTATERAGGTIAIESRKAMIAAPLEEPPTTGDTLTLGGADYSIGKVWQTAPAGIAVLYIAEATRG